MDAAAAERSLKAAGHAPRIYVKGTRPRPPDFTRLHRLSQRVRTLNGGVGLNLRGQ